ncbi:pq loop repeat protein [Ophiostoma piceae UAMH 11346]|uniref:Pq loop repeat protein n=1 Tax=Ophiostoma piceae (strain UAMH 11346) TaxID=1262450 RepID=S3BRV0_OPHP1|nr:pq loop repeat protein [Ophiostoma piceae UAMH 11346]
MVPPTGPLNLDVEAISGICGSISIACWVVVFSPQIFENFRRGSADGLSLQFIIVWLAGDVFNILGAVLQHVLPTMIILAVYYTIADIVLLGQCFYYRGFTWRDEVVPPPQQKKKVRRSAAPAAPSNTTAAADERTALLGNQERRGSNWSALSPAVPFAPEADTRNSHRQQQTTTRPRSSTLQTVVFNALAMLMVCVAGVAGWYLSGGSKKQDKTGSSDDDSNGGDIVFSYWGQVFGYMCAVLYLGSRLPQLLLNWRRQSTDGVSMLFFLFACLGNLTYVMSIFAYDGCSASASPDTCTADEARRQYGRYLLVNLSWLAGSLGTLLLDMGIFIQFFLYRVEGDDTDEEYANDDSVTEHDVLDNDDDTAATEVDDESEDERPLLRRNMSSYHS